MLNHYFDYDYYYGAEYMRVRDYLKRHSIDDSVPMLIDRIMNDSIICKIDSIGVVVEVGFNDRNQKLSIYQIFQLVYEGTKYGKVVDIEPVLDKETMINIVKLIDFIAG